MVAAMTDPATDHGTDHSTEHDPVADLHARAERIRTEMGGAAKVQRLHDAGDVTIREHIDAFVDPGSFQELGTFSRSLRPEDRPSTPGDGKIGGHATVDGRQVVVFGDDVTVRRGSSSVVGGRKLLRLEERALDMGVPIVHFGQTGGGRIPDLIGSEGISDAGEGFRHHRHPAAPGADGDRHRGRSFGGSSFQSALSDFVVMVDGACLAVTSPRVFEIATGEVVTFDEVGGVDVHARLTGQIDLGVDTDEEAYAAIRRWLSYLPPNAWTAAPRAEPAGSLEPDPEMTRLVPDPRTRGYDMRRVVARLCDPGRVFELQPAVRPPRHLRAGPHRRLVRRRDRQQPDVPGRRARPRGLPQDHPPRVPVRRLQPAGGLPRRRARLHGRQEGRARPDPPPGHADDAGAAERGDAHASPCACARRSGWRGRR